MFVRFLVNWVKDTLFGLFYSNEYSKEWDQELKELIQEYGATATTDGFVITLNDTNVWVGQRFYLFHYGHKFSWSTEYRPSVLTMYKLRKLQERLDKNKEKEDEDTL